jgi:L-ascorbate metabolism protein UlaG (beta-lactamase superfamily)
MRLRLAGTLLLLSLLSPALDGQSGDTIRTTDGDITVVPIAHGTLALVRGEQVILIDPARFVPGQPEVPRADLQEMAKAYVAKFGGPPPSPPPGSEPDPALLVSAAPVRPEQMSRFRALKPSVILVTHTHTDHLDPRAIAALSRADTRLIVPTSANGMLLDLQGAQTMANGERRVLGDLVIDAVPMYNTRPDPTLGSIFHPKGRGNGYVITMGGTRFYVAGDTACTAEMRELRNIDVAFVPMNLPYTMSPAEAAECVRAFTPRVVYPYHFFESDLTVFETALKGTGVEVRLRDWYAR